MNYSISNYNKLCFLLSRLAGWHLDNYNAIHKKSINDIFKIGVLPSGYMTLKTDNLKV